MSDLFSHVEHAQPIRQPLGTTPEHEGPWSVWLDEDVEGEGSE